MLLALSIFAVVLFITVHLLVGRLTILDREPHDANWHSFAGGVAIGYAFESLLPKLAKQQQYLEASTDGGLLGFLEHHVYLVAVAGLVLYFGLSRAAVYLDSLSIDRSRLVTLRRALAYTDVAGAAAYFMLVAYLVSELDLLIPLVLFALVMALHFLGLDHGFRRRYRKDYDPRIRWLFAATTLIGGCIGWFTEVSDLIIAVFTAFLAGGIISYSLRQELPHDSHLRFWPFFIGVTIFSIANLVIEILGKG